MTLMRRNWITTLVLFFSSHLLLASAFTGTPLPPAFATGVVGIVVTTAARRRTLLFVEPQKETTVTKAGAAADNAEKKKASDDDDDDDGGAEKSENMLDKIKEAGLAGFISYAFWELAFWLISVPFALGGYVELTGHWPDFSNQEDLAKLGAEAFAFVNVARLAVPIRIGLAISTIPWVEENIVERFSLLKDNETKESAADEQKDSADVVAFNASSLESEKKATASERKEGPIQRVLSSLPFRRSSKE